MNISRRNTLRRAIPGMCYEKLGTNVECEQGSRATNTNRSWLRRCTMPQLWWSLPGSDSNVIQEQQHEPVRTGRSLKIYFERSNF